MPSVASKPQANGAKAARKFDIEATLATLSPPDKVALLGGADFWHTAAFPDKGIPALRTSDGPNGVRGTIFQNGTPSNCFPCALGIAAAWDDGYAAEMGEYLAKEAIAKNVHVVLGPTLNIQRSPLGGRGFEAFSEDPVLSGRVAGYYVKGMQSKGVAATPKHYVCNDQEFERQSSDSILSMRALREIYLEPFRIMQKIGDPRAYMTGYNRVNGLHVSEHPFLLNQVLRKEWGFDGAVMSDWTGVYSGADSLLAGLDLEMPGPPKFRGDQLMRQIACGKLDNDDVDVAARNVLKLVKFAVESGRTFGTTESVPEDDDTRAFMRKAAGEAVVLLANDKQILPLGANAKSIAVIGQNAERAVTSGGGSASLRSAQVVSPLEAISQAAKSTGGTVKWALGSRADIFVPLVTPYLRNDGASGSKLKLEVWLNRNSPGEDWLGENSPFVQPTCSPDHVKGDLTDGLIMLFDELPGCAIEQQWTRCTATFVPDESGDWEFGFGSAGSYNLFLDGQLLIDNSTQFERGELFFMAGSSERRAVAKGLVKDRAYQLEIRGRFRFNDGAIIQLPFGARIGAQLVVDPQQYIQEAVDLATASDVAVVIVGLNGEVESEGKDRKDLELPGHQNPLVDAVLAANPNTIIVNQSGMPVRMPWVSKAHTLLQAFYGGDEGGNGIADVLFGKVNPSARLPISMPYSLKDVPATPGFGDRTPNPGKVVYTEDIHVGYRHYESFDVPVAFTFGHGMSYTTFSYSSPEVSPVSAEGSFEVKIDVTNTGSLAGKEVVQVYIKDVKSSSVRAALELKGYAKPLLQPGETKTVTIPLDRDALKFFDEKRDRWVAEAGDFEVLVGPTLKDLRESATITLQKTLVWRDGKE